MALHVLDGDVGLPGERGRPVVVVPLYGAHDLFVRCLQSVLAHTPEGTVLLIADDAGPDPASLELVRRLDSGGLLSHEVYWLRQPSNLGFVGNVNAAFALTAPADVVLVNSDVVVADGWLAGLRDAAYSDSLIATATALTNHGSIVSVPGRNAPVPDLPQDRTLDQVAAQLRRRSLRLYPRLPVAIGHCVYVRRSGIELVGYLDECFSPGYGEEVDLSQRQLMMGLQHVAADDVLVLHTGAGSFGVEGQGNPVQIEHEELLRSRYPSYHAGVEDAAGDQSSRLARSLAIARQVVRGRYVTVDARCLGPTMTGTQVLALELIGGLVRSGEVKVRAIVPDTLGPYARTALDGLPGLELLAAAEASEQAASGALRQDDVVHRPYQVSDPEDLELLAGLGNRLVITQQDLIAFRNPDYHDAARSWMRYRTVTAEVLARAALVVFSSHHAAADAVAEDLVAEDRTRVVRLGVDHQLVGAGQTPRRPSGVPEDGRPFLVILGAQFRHKNRVFALRLLVALRELGWDGRLVLAGPNPADGSSAGAEAEFLAAEQELVEHLVRLPAVDDAERTWLYREAAAVVYPTTYEGFGFVPFEAAEVGTPCLFAPQASLPEVLGADSAVLVPWNAEDSARATLGVLRDPASAEALVGKVRAAAQTLTWDATVRGLLAVYDDAVQMPQRDLLRDALKDTRYWNLRTMIGPTGMSLVGDEKARALLDEPSQRALAALARRRPSRRVLLGVLGLTHRAVVGAREDKRS